MMVHRAVNLQMNSPCAPNVLRHLSWLMVCERGVLCFRQHTARQQHWPTKHNVYVFTFLIYRHQQIFYIEMNKRMHYSVIYKNLFNEIDKYLQKYTKNVWKFNRNVILDWNGWFSLLCSIYKYRNLRTGNIQRGYCAWNDYKNI